MKLFKMYTPQLTMARDGNQQTALHWLARKPSEILRMFHFHLCIYICI